MAIPAPRPQIVGLSDLLIGGMVIAVALAFFIFLQVRTGTGRLSSYDMTVEMPDAGGLKLGTAVRIGGVKVGSIAGLSLSAKDHQALVRLDVRDDLRLPADSFFVVSKSVMSDVYLSIEPGRAKASIPPGSIVHRPRPRARAPSPGV